ncbi:hypothetical protein PG5_13880 [Pseudomonas sp. G5(2012)]|nr:hypothetical protein PG5_13880 [Pseudomonas sp. G5(2012)]
MTESVHQCEAGCRCIFLCDIYHWQHHSFRQKPANLAASKD